MKIYKDGMTLMRDTASLMNAVMENKAKTINVGDTFAELLWTDRTLWVVTKVISDRKFVANRAKTYMENWADGTEYPVKDENGKIVADGEPRTFTKKRKYWYRSIHANAPATDGHRVHLSWGATTGYRDPSF